MNLFESFISPGAQRRAADLLARGRVSEGEMVRLFEERLSSELGLSRPAALNSGTSALHLALVLAGVGPGDEIILPPQTFVATGLAVLMQGARPVFADIDPETGNLDPERLVERITGRTRAVMPVHWAGLPCDLDEIHAVADEHGLAVVEDAAHALGALYRGRPVGSISRFTAFSFQAIKHLTTGDGGALCCRDETDHRLAMRLRWFGIDRAAEIGPSGERDINIEVRGFKYHMNDLAAAVGLGNLEGFTQRLATRRCRARRYRSALENTAGISLLRQDTDRESACWIFTLRVERRADFIRALKGRGIPASVVHRRIDRHSVFDGLTPGLAGQECFEERQVSLPLHDLLSEEDVERVIAAVREGW